MSRLPRRLDRGDLIDGCAAVMDPYRCNAPLFHPNENESYGRCDTLLHDAIVLNGVVIKRHCKQSHIRP